MKTTGAPADSAIGLRALRRWEAWLAEQPEARARLERAFDSGDEAAWRQEFDALWSAAQNGNMLPPETVATMLPAGRA